VRRLRHPIRAIREPFGTAGLIIAMVALVAALGGSAVAANSALSGKQKKEVEKIAKKFAGAPGAAGPTGPGGAAGTAGKDGSNGTNGKDGINGTGTNGTNGTNGKSPEATPFTGTKTVGSVTCSEGGVTVKSASPETAICNGAGGSGGGYPNFLPKGKTEAGTWALAVGESEESAGGGRESVESGVASFSFNIPLEPPALGAELFHTEILKEFQTGPHCSGGTDNPTADPGFLCIYTGEAIGPGAEALFHPGGLTPVLKSTSGAILFAVVAPHTYAYGSWALTAEEEA
jgi:hypothetical protein